MYIVLPLALVFAALAVWAFIWAVRGGQMDDLQTPAARMLLDEDAPKPKRPADETPSHDAPADAAADASDHAKP